MKTLLTSSENLANCINVYNENYTAFMVKGEPRGKIKQSGVEWHNRDDYQSLQLLFHMLGLYDYIDMDLDEDMLYMRINIEE